jgi:phenylpropionate dioxygenase-like ring-hydroxylating dioxygenase large terminal subunit
MTTGDTIRDVDPKIGRHYYRDDEVVQQEFRRVFARSWLLLGHESEISEPGDYVTRRMGADNVILSRDESGVVNVMLNSCTHRGTQVCKASSGNSATFICGYHGWLFGNDGALRGVPGRNTLYSRDFDLSQHGLRKARVGIAHGLVFATWEQEGPSLQEYLGDFDWYLGALFDFFPGGMELYGGVHRVVVRGNWKIHTENFAGDGYHLRIAHRTMFELGVMGEQAKEAQGWLVTDPHGHSLRAQFIKDPNVKNVVFGHPQELLDAAMKTADADQQAFRSGTSVIHGALFPNSVLITTAPTHFGSDAHGQTAFYQMRMLNPIDAHSHEVVYFSLVPKAAPEEWKKKSYLFSIRQHGAASFFEADDLENFRRIDAGVSGIAGTDAPFNYELGIGAADGAPPPWNGPGRIVSQDLSESNQRNYIRRYLEVMGQEEQA